MKGSSIHVIVLDECNRRDVGFINSILLRECRYYPNFDEWLLRKFRYGHVCGERTVMVAKYLNRPAGVALLKKSDLERKICTFYIFPDYRCKGVGARLMADSISFLGEKRIGISVSDRNLGQLGPLIGSNGFKLDAKLEGFYRAGVSEFFFSRGI